MRPQECMQDPVVAADGYTYERHAIEQWLGAHRTSPMTNERMEHTRVRRPPCCCRCCCCRAALVLTEIFFHEQLKYFPISRQL